MGTTTLSSQAFNWSNPWCTTTKWASILPLSDGKWGNQAPYPKIVLKWAHLKKLVTLREPNHTCAEERWDLVTLYWLQGPKQNNNMKSVPNSTNLWPS
jgi:hypothetical protein